MLGEAFSCCFFVAFSLPLRVGNVDTGIVCCRNQDYYESGAVTSQAHENLEAMLRANMENVDAPSVSQANELRQDVLRPGPINL